MGSHGLRKNAPPQGRAGDVLRSADAVFGGDLRGRGIGHLCKAGRMPVSSAGECFQDTPSASSGTKKAWTEAGVCLIFIFMDYIIDDVKDIIYILKFANLYYHTPTQNAIGFVIFLQNLQLKRRFFALSPHKCTCLARRGEKAGVSGSKKTEVFPSLPSARTKHVSSLHHRGRGTAPAVEGVRLLLSAKQKCHIAVKSRPKKSTSFVFFGFSLRYDPPL